MLEDEPYRQQIIETQLNEEFISKVKILLRNYIADGNPEQVSSTIGLLGKFGDKADKKLYEEWLESSLANVLLASRIMHQSLTSLDTLSKSGSVLSYSLVDINSGVNIARGYLKTQGKDIAW